VHVSRNTLKKKKIRLQNRRGAPKHPVVGRGERDSGGEREDESGPVILIIMTRIRRLISQGGEE